MEKRREINDRLVEWIADRAKMEFGGEISLVVVYGSHVNGTGNRLSDVDCFYVPRTERAAKSGVAFILDGVGYDIFPVSWERLEGIADLNESLLPFVGDGRIIYSASSEDEERYRGLQERLRHNLTNCDIVRRVVHARCKFAAWLMGQLERAENPADVRHFAGWIMMFLAEAAAVYTGDYFHCGLKRQLEDLRDKFPGMPSEIYEAYRDTAMAASTNEVRNCARKLFFCVCRYVGAENSIPEAEDEAPGEIGEINAAELAGLYEEIVSTFNKIYINIETGNVHLAYISAVCLQHEFMEAGEFGCPAYDLPGSYDAGNPAALAARAREIEADFVRIIEENGGVIKRYDTFEDFAAAGLWRLTDEL